MADTNQQQQEVPEPPQTNGVLDGLTEEEKSRMRPADIDADMREMERRKRVEMMMNSRLFREELERIIETQMKDGSGPSGLLQQISEMMGPQGARFNANVFRNSNCVVPINDIRGVESMGYAKGEKLLRCKLAAVFRLLDLYGWTQGVGGTITARLNQHQEHFLVNPYGLLYHEVTASSLVKVDMQGGVVEQGTTNFGVHIASYNLHSTIHAARPDIKCIVHIATPSVTAISATKCGLLPLDQESIVIGEVSTHHYISSGSLDPEEREKIARNFGPINKVMLLTNRGALCCGETIEEAFFNVYNTVLACETQLKLMPLGIDNLFLISDEARKTIYEASRKAPVPQQSSVAEPSPLAEKLEKRWRIGSTEFEALMRMLDNAGFRTGYIYRHPLVKSEPPRPRNDVEVPPAVSSLGYLLEEEELYKQGLWKGGRKGTDRTRWLNSPNVYQKVEILETGTPDPKKITKWVSDGSPTHSSTPVKIEGALQFVPKNTNPKEFKQLQQQIKEYRRADKISAGPQSHILEGVTWEEAKKMQDATISGTGEQVVLVGAASKGIIQRGFQHNAMVYKTPYAKNPFDAVTDQELDQYKKEIERKTKGDIYDESQSESEALSSFNISRATHDTSTAKSPIQSPVSVASETEEESRDEPKVLRIETKQVPAPSQPEVVLSDERSVEPLVVENPVARREDVKSEHSNAQQRTNIKTVNADFLNEQRRSEMMTRRNTNGRGVSGVSRFSSSRSNSSIEDFWPWVDEGCHLETARAQELARPMKAVITDIQKVSTINRKMKQEFFKNYENRFNNDIEVNDKIKSEENNKTSKFQVLCDKFDGYKEENEKSGVKRLLEVDIETEVNNIQYSKNASMNFAEKINLSVENIIDEKNMYNVIQRSDKNKSCSPIMFETDMDNNNSIEINQMSNEFNVNSSSTLIPCSENEIDSDEKESSKRNDVKKAEIVSDVNDNKSECIYINEVRFPVNIHSDEGINILDKKCRKFETENNKNVEYRIEDKIEIQNNIDENFIVNLCETINNCFDSNYESEEENSYVSEADIFVFKNSSNLRNQITNEIDIKDHKDPLEFSLKKGHEEADDCYSQQANSSTIQQFDSNSIPEVQGTEASIGFNHSTPFSVTDIENNPLEASLRTFLKDENDQDDSKSDPSIEISNATVMDNEELEDPYINSNKNQVCEKSDDNLFVKPICSKSIDDNVKCIKFPKTIPSSLNFSFSDIEKNSEDFSPASTNRGSFFSDDYTDINRIIRRDSILDVAGSIDANLKPSSKFTVDPLADTENSVKYNLDSQSMSLIYSITPPNDIGDSSRNTTMTENIFEDNEEDYNKSFKNDDNEEMIWINLLNTTDRKSGVDMNKTTELSETSFLSNISNQGSDILELSKHTFLDLQKSSEENFHKNISSSVNEIITELNEHEVFVTAANFVNEIFFEISCLNLPRDVSGYSKSELQSFVREKIWALRYSKKLAKDLVENLPCYDTFSSTNSKVSNSDETDGVETEQSIYVIHEIIHHVVDKDSLGTRDFKSKKSVTDKKIKESMNIELKGLKEEYDAIDEQSLKCSTPKSLSPCRSRCNSVSEEESLVNVCNDDETPEIIEETVITNSKSQQSSDTVVSSNSSPSGECHNYAEQEVTSESTDNDTKSDNSKEKQTDTCETLTNKSNSSNDQVNSKISLDSLNIPVSQNDECKLLEMASKKVSFCIIECATEDDFGFKKETQEVSDDRKSDSTDSESIKDFMQSLVHEEEIAHMWELQEAQLEELYTTKRLQEITDIKQTLECQEIIQSLYEVAQTDATSELPSIEEQSTSFIILDDTSDERSKSHSRFEKVDECCPCCVVGTSIILENTLNNTLLSITEEPELESLDNVKSKDSELESSENKESKELEFYETVNSFETLSPIFEEPECNSSLEDDFDNMSHSKTAEFYSCQNSSSMKSCDGQEAITSTFTFTTEESESEKTYSADVSANNDTASIASAVVCKSESTISQEVNGIEVHTNVTENFADISNTSSLSINNNEVVTLDYMTYSYDTNEFINLEMACKNNHDESNYVCCEFPKSTSLMSFPNYEDTALCKLVSATTLSDSLSTTSYESSGFS